MIESFRHRGLRRFFESDDRSRLSQDLLVRIAYILSVLNEAETIEEIAGLDSLRLHQLKGDRKGQWAVTVRANWRITFRMAGQVVTDVDLVDYH